MVDPLPSLSIRAVSLIALLPWVPVVASFRFAPGRRWVEYVGIFFHLAVFLLVFKLLAPDWAKAAGYGWLLLDVAAGARRINQVQISQAQPAIAQQVRLGGAHLCGDLDCHGVVAGLACDEAGGFARWSNPFRLYPCVALSAESMA